MGKGANRSSRCCRDSPCHNEKGNGGTGWGISHDKTSCQKLHETALEWLILTSETTENMGSGEEGVRFRTGDEFISFTDRNATRTRSGRELIPNARGVTTNNRFQDLGIWLEQASSCPGVGSRTLAVFSPRILRRPGTR